MELFDERTVGRKSRERVPLMTSCTLRQAISVSGIQPYIRPARSGIQPDIRSARSGIPPDLIKAFI
jgi:hypothetical protein